MCFLIFLKKCRKFGETECIINRDLDRISLLKKIMNKIFIAKFPIKVENAKEKSLLDMHRIFCHIN